MKILAQSYSYCSGMDSEKENMVENCSNCAQTAKLPAKNQPIPWPAPTSAWSRIHMDFAGPLLVVDTFSKWPDIFAMRLISPTAVIARLTYLFSQYGLPDTIVTDDRSQPVSSEFEAFCNRHAIDHYRTSVYHPQSNGQAERFVDTFKRALTKMNGEGTTEEVLNIFLRIYRTTPNRMTPNGKSPVVLLGQTVRTLFDKMRSLTTSHETTQSNFSMNQGDKEKS